MNEVNYLHIWNVKLSGRSRKSLGKRFSERIEGGNWYLSSDTYLYSSLKGKLEDEMCEFYDIPGNKIVEIDSLETNILSFEDGVYPNFEK